MYLKNLDNSSTSEPKNSDIVAWVDQAYKMLKHQKVTLQNIQTIFQNSKVEILFRMILKQVSRRLKSFPMICKSTKEIFYDNHLFFFSVSFICSLRWRENTRKIYSLWQTLKILVSHFKSYFQNSLYKSEEKS